MFRLVGGFEGSCNIVQEYTADDASPTPHTRNGSQIEMPAESVGSTLQHGESLGIRDEFGSIKSRKDILYEFRLIIYRLCMLALELLGSQVTQVFLRRKASFEYRRGN